MPPTENYAFVMNVASLAGESYTVMPGHTLRRAIPDEVEEIRQKLEFISGARGLSLHGTLLWEGQLPLTGTRPTRAPQSEWRYHVVSFTGNNAIVNDLETPANLAAVEIELGFVIMTGPGGGRGLMFNPGRMFHVLQFAGMDSSFFVTPSRADVAEVTRLYSQLQRDDRELEGIKRLARRISDLKNMPHRSPLRFLGYVAILEAFLTHIPKPSDPYDSITRQIKKKLTLLNNRFEKQIDYAPFGTVDPEKLWAKIYEYRSRLAHGGNPEFSGDLALLGNYDQALRLVKETVKTVARQALSEPRLLLDLREC